ncbi:helix-turn-helix transcriptional regulator [Halomonas sp. AOP43-D1-4]|uniref:helix-turn-helix transcriptional regulator n=1 Tax=Halomonas sp. AOP43-D1-4 TaxID=3457658 RepID=UPI0040344CC8
MAQLLPMKQVAEKVGYCESKVYAMIREGEFPPGKKMATGGVRWLDEEVDAWIMRAYAQAQEARLRLA